MNLDRFYSRVYNEKTYNCAHFVCEVWKDLTGEDITHKLTGMMTVKNERVVDPKLRFKFKKLDGKPNQPCLIVMHRRRIGSHVGIYLNDKVLHITESGVERVSVEIATYGFDKFGFYL